MTPRFLSIYFVLLLGISCNSQKPGGTNEPWLLPFNKPASGNPVLQPAPASLFLCPVSGKTVRWEQKDVFNPAAVMRHDTLFLIYRAEDTVGKHAGTSRIGLAWSNDGIHFNRYAQPVLYPAKDEQLEKEWDGGCEDPRVVQDEAGRYYMTYTAYDGDKARLFVASSDDLLHWTKYGSAFATAFRGKYAQGWSKSGSIVSSYRNGTPVATRINGKYWMYWGDTHIWAASSLDLIHWVPFLYTEEEMKDSTLIHSKDYPELKSIVVPRKGKFDSDLVEPGPPAVLTEKGILLLYNGRNSETQGDTQLSAGSYCAGQVLMDPNEPSRILERNENYFLKPDQPYEIEGQVNRVCFIEGLVRKSGKWLLYYGTADSRIAVAEMKAEKK